MILHQYRDQNQFIKFVESLEGLCLSEKHEPELIIEDKDEVNKRYRLKYDESFDQYSFEEIQGI